MKKADGFLILSLMAFSLLCLIPMFRNTQSAAVAVVKIRNEEKMRIDLQKDGDYEVEGTNGPVHITVRDGAVAVTQENSPHHYCSLQGFVDSVNTPIVCLPNDTVITIEGEGGQEDTVIS